VQPIFGQGGSEPLDTPLERGPALKALRWAGCRNCLGESCTSFSGSLYLSRGGSFLLSAIGKVEQEKERGKTKLAEGVLRRFEQRYTEILDAGRKANPPPPREEKRRGRMKKGKVLSLVERLWKHREAVLRFMHDYRVPFSLDFHGPGKGTYRSPQNSKKPVFALQNRSTVSNIDY